MSYIRPDFTDKVKAEFVEKSYLLLDEIAVYTQLYMPRYLATLFTSIK